MKFKTGFRYGDKVKVIDGFYQELFGTLKDYDENQDNFLIELWQEYDQTLEENEMTVGTEVINEVFVCKAFIHSENLEKINEK